MKFYFCEKCGKRITEQDIATGDASDKKLKGVFCMSCAIGVTTMDVMPMADSEARELLEKARASGTEPASKTDSTPKTTRRRRRTSSSNLNAIAGSKRDSSRRQIQVNDLAPTNQSTKVVVISAAVGVLGLLVVAGSIDTSGSPQTGTPAKKVGDSETEFPKTSVAVTPSQSIQPAHEEPTDPETAAAAAFDALISFEGLDPTDLKGRVDRLEAFLTRHGGTIVAARARRMRDELKTAALSKPDVTAGKPATHPPDPPKQNESSDAETAETNKPKEAIKETAAPATRPATPKPDKDQINKLLEGMLEALRESGAGAATELLAGHTQVPEDVRTELRKGLKLLRDHEKGYRHALQKLIGKEVALETTRGKIRGKATKLEHDAIYITQRFLINGRMKDGGTVKVSLDDLSHTTREKIHPTSPPQDEDGRFALALTRGANGKSDEAIGLLADCREYSLAKPLSGLLARKHARAREAEACSAWQDLDKRGRGKLSLALSKLLLKEVAAFEEKYGDTAFAKESPQPKARAELKASLQRMSLGMDPRVAKLFRGHIKEYDPRTQRIALQYDMSNQQHWKDFALKPKDKLADKSGVYRAKAGVHLRGKGVWNALLHMRQFVSGDLEVTVHYSEINKPGQGATLNIAFHGPGSEGKARKVYASFRQGVFLSGPDYRGRPYDVTFAKASLPNGVPKKCVIEWVCKGKHYRIKLNDKVVLKKPVGKDNDHRGFSLGCGWDTFFNISHIQVKGRIDPRWLKSALANLNRR